MASHVDWKGVIRELRLLVTQIQPLRFLALYALVLIAVISLAAGYVIEKMWRVL